MQILLMKHSEWKWKIQSKYANTRKSALYGCASTITFSPLSFVFYNFFNSSKNDIQSLLNPSWKRQTIGTRQSLTCQYHHMTSKVNDLEYFSKYFVCFPRLPWRKVDTFFTKVGIFLPSTKSCLSFCLFQDQPYLHECHSNCLPNSFTYNSKTFWAKQMKL